MVRHKKAQNLVLTTIFVVFIFFLVLTLFFDDLFTNPRMESQRYEHLEREADRAARTLASDGYPQDWDEDNVLRAGVLTKGVFNYTKAKLLHDNIAYADLKEKLGITHQYYLNITHGVEEIIIQEPGSITKDSIIDQARYLATRTRTVTSTDGTATITIHVYRGIP